ncbi:hypothetical protein Bpfe_022082 [Biomphalaria pfeifferi]|uniref:Uncharacterized protein n=1 Tax=Biomphalaria pfeifferi TaxID=112525 RepID=A0AAD8F1P3_BIOPF|nr:hypothetical protein Bpfe_022082 [Biomphalaria pfeifferi]
MSHKMAESKGSYSQFKEKDFLQKQVAELSRILVGKTNGQNIWSTNNIPQGWPSDVQWKNPTSSPKDTLDVLKLKFDWLRSKTRHLLAKEQIQLFDFYDEGNKTKLITFIEIHQKYSELRNLNADLEFNTALISNVVKYFPEIQTYLVIEIQKLLNKFNSEQKVNLLPVSENFTILKSSPSMSEESDAVIDTSWLSDSMTKCLRLNTSQSMSKLKGQILQHLKLKSPEARSERTAARLLTPSETHLLTPSETHLLIPSETLLLTSSETHLLTPSETPLLTPSETPLLSPSETPLLTPPETPLLTPLKAPKPRKQSPTSNECKVQSQRILKSRSELKRKYSSAYVEDKEAANKHLCTGSPDVSLCRSVDSHISLDSGVDSVETPLGSNTLFGDCNELTIKSPNSQLWTTEHPLRLINLENIKKQDLDFLGKENFDFQILNDDTAIYGNQLLDSNTSNCDFSYELHQPHLTLESALESSFDPELFDQMLDKL